MSQTTAEIDFLSFCGPPYEKQFRYDFNKPCIANGKLYCANGAIGIRLDVPPEGVAELSEKFPESAFELIDSVQPSTVGVPCPEVEGPPEGADRWWSIYVKGGCDSCLGSGDCECDCGHTHECSDCNGTGKHEGYEIAEGAGDPIVVGDSKYQRQHIWRISRLPGALVYPDSLIEMKTGKALPFTFEGGVGLLMPLSDG